MKAPLLIVDLPACAMWLMTPEANDITRTRNDMNVKLVDSSKNSPNKLVIVHNVIYIYIHIHIPYCIPIVGDRYIQSILASFDFDDVVVHVLEIPPFVLLVYQFPREAI